ncbi:SsrA-binding protein [Candidatus Uhrbacteria bacterium RIFCSPHIGHO2_02_FULL_47_44]|uniref:SsrA-binding protein n=1 Tax=Candidatus Uhrbacteria bacterium RIFCSPLOWO2_02_FULL_48_18 TaxID=1802408 RepID=A0A1F7V8Z2_9BACT|nr:MAG: SsrA-binding protein [Candidatus Uhrbacteria bacterium RIFCSPHIGHO2_01_FULL_47_10]OGL71622.1 MAG: SsrA-binding protein [Candidatus Uhrbacteria bacterium RIFCSPHIGHO2_02_FULL_47_44]OGL76591.1 MAG: SsrA-binding protein [Candidatus Uhrbacteria bacterium RIFCSPHIGHO2_12_FULL_47_12]OGL80789.1 MAG: SsrA-binding protein [Candidatus Uhrbacteria bacterium RIFCSPLOWO2_01_FULL_47_17]OGL86558.1 MAG: SsrA-binding protein [Candidatus Uhrbacteria bacterium RIFCSPLOWO2_02_FULL_48_18]
MPSLATNKKAGFDFDLQEEFEAGLVLLGWEVKSAKAGHVQLKGAFLHISNGELWLKNAFISPYKPAGNQEVQSDRDRKVLVHKRELKRLIGKKLTEGLTLVPLRIYTKGNLVKLVFAIAKGKKKYEKREAIKKRDVDRQMKEHMRQ